MTFRNNRPGRLRRRAGYLSVLAACIAAALAGCGSSSSSGSGASNAAASSGVPRVAFFGYENGNTFTDAMFTGIQSAIKTAHGTAYFFSSNTSATTQLAQVTDAISSKKYNVFIVHADDAVSLTGAVKTALKDGIKVIAIFNPLGPNLNTAAVQIPGLSGSVVVPVNTTGADYGKLIGEACKGVSSCQVQYMPGDNTLPLEIDRTRAVQAAVAKYPNVHLLGMVQGGYTPATGEAAALSVLSAHPNVQVIVGSDQAVFGVQEALSPKGLLPHIKLIGGGGTYQALQGVRDGKWFGDQIDCPATYGTLAGKMAAELVEGKHPASTVINGANACPSGATLTKGNLGSFTGQYSAG
jgi:ribose transport system substrate-binding protein